jgi:type VI protein secretion system component VasF
MMSRVRRSSAPFVAGLRFIVAVLRLGGRRGRRRCMSGRNMHQRRRQHLAEQDEQNDGTTASESRHGN